MKKDLSITSYDLILGYKEKPNCKCTPMSTLLPQTKNKHYVSKSETMVKIAWTIINSNEQIWHLPG